MGLKRREYQLREHLLRKYYLMCLIKLVRYWLLESWVTVYKANTNKN